MRSNGTYLPDSGEGCYAELRTLAVDGKLEKAQTFARAAKVCVTKTGPMEKIGPYYYWQLGKRRELILVRQLNEDVDK